MKKLKTQDIAPGVRQPFGAVSAAHIQEGFAEALAALARGVIQDHGGVVILHGAAVTRADQVFTVTAGAAFHAGEVFPVLASTFAAPAGEIGVWKVAETFVETDPVTFTDLVPRNVHAIRTLVLEAGAAGSGLADYNGTETFPERMGKEIKMPPLVWHDAVLQVVPSSMADYRGLEIQYCKDALGVVRLRGILQLDQDSYASHLFTLPPGFRPGRETLNGGFVGTLLGNHHCSIMLGKNGRVIQQTTKENSNLYVLDGMSFVAEL